MKTYNMNVIDMPTNVIGFGGENGVTEVVLDFSSWAEEFGQGSISLLVRRAMDADPYPAVLETDGTTATWTITDVETSYKGHGEAQWIYTVDEQIKKSAVFGFNVDRSLNSPVAETPEAYQTWVDDMIALGAGVAEIAEEVYEATGHYPKIENGYWYVWDVANEDWVNTNQKAQGEQGIQGIQGVGVASTVLNADYTLTITLTDGTSYTTPSIRGEQGIQGDPGQKGDPGMTPDIEIGTVTTLDEGSDATVTITGTDEQPLLNFGIPKGDTGTIDTAIVAEDYANLTFPVAKGTPCIYDGDYYVAKQDINASEAWTSAHWDQTNVGDDILSVKSALTDTQDELEDVINSISTLVPSTPANSIDVTEYAGETIPKVTSTINVGSAISSVKLYCCGKNHLKLKNQTGGKNQLTWVMSENGTITINGTSDRLQTIRLADVLSVYNTKWRVSIQRSAENSGVNIVFSGQKRADVFEYGGYATAYGERVDIQIDNGAVCDNLVIQPMIEFGDYPETVTYEPFYGFIKEHTFDPSVTTAEVDWGAVDIPANTTTMWIYATSNLTTIYKQQSTIDELVERVEDIEDSVSDINGQIETLEGDIDDAYAHKYIIEVDGWTDVTYYTTGFIDDNGNVATYGTNIYWYTDFVTISENDKVNYNLYGGVNLVTFYNSSKERISSVKGTSGQWNSGTVYSPTNSAYVRFSEAHGTPNGTFTIERWTVRTGDENKADIEEYADSLVTLDLENVVITTGDVKLFYDSVYNDRKIYAITDGVRTDYIPVSEGDTIQYRLYINGASPVYQYAIAVFDESKTQIAYVTESSNGWVDDTYTVPSGASFVMISWMRNFLTQNGWFSISASSSLQEVKDYIPVLNNRPNSNLRGKQWCCMGDSITSGASDVRPYYDWIQDRTAITPYNFGLSSTAIAKDSASTTTNMATRYADMYDDVDYVTVFGGTNDHGRSIPVGQWGDADQMTLYGAMKILCEGLINKYIGKKIGFILPLPKCTTVNNVTTDYSYPSTSFLPYIECIKDVCARYSIPVLDLYTQSDLHPSISAFRTAMMPDGLHPNSDGQELLSYRIQAFLESL